MKQLSLLALAVALSACSSPSGDPAGKATPAASPDADGADAHSGGATRLTVYSGDYESLANVRSASAGMPGYALVERPLRFDLKRGGNSLSDKPLPPSMDVEAAVLQPRSPGVSVVGQRYIAPVSGAQNVVGVAIGRKVSVEHTAGGAKQTDSGVLLAAGDGLTLALDDGRVKVIRSYDSFSLVDNDNVLPRQSALQWTVNAAQAGNADFVLSYPMGGMAWRAEYRATLASGGGCKLALDGAALVANRSGRAFNDVRLSLVAGEPNRTRNLDFVQVTGSRIQADSYAVAAPAAPPPPMPLERAAGEYHAYDLSQPASLNNGGTERIALFPRNDAVACERIYSLEASDNGWQPPTPLIDRDYGGQTGDIPVVSKVEFKNDKASGLGLPLPAGRVRAFDGGDFLGESQLQHTPSGADIKLELGKVFDLSGKREATAFQLDRTGRTITESFAITVKNAKKNLATVRVTEPLPRWTDWEIVSSSLPSKKKDARHAQFEVPVPAEGETKLTYTVRYRWPQDVKP
ncbi:MULTISPECIES: DUF4139 domain-containing protein [unclassified Lysobacter]|uniref:DUF4139 domain-containing protein n=1 Tax=unclassified Lysobacter TaxID=2635362 RepID=UPI001BE55509|nr:MULTISPECIES: DUF4139 domain-containing protein [unclassified Lysobacter]MBT2746175.1 DUF4139 domain-containing protein [Lysobacter sp. ISL-42]MBT2753173.1 DUF4139 domain-containing protein [Lysobacter sp. ISL-50]MBT2776887.1 DUF4139 domain-containing protein [Lysobacter sp. ISL-54]MBT2782366.1 DUF4139 domain-containing protein [Lysobacter sp. ISL-52]